MLLLGGVLFLFFVGALPGALAQSSLPDVSLGDPNAPITLIEYASLTCSFCARFHQNTYKRFVRDYVDTGKVYFIFREFPLDSLATLAAMLVRCGSDQGRDADRYFAFVDLLLRTQQQWASSREPVAELKKVMRLGGMGEAEFERCRRDRALFDGVKAISQEGQQRGVTSTPTFILNDQESFSGALSYEELQFMLDTR